MEGLSGHQKHGTQRCACVGLGFFERLPEGDIWRFKLYRISRSDLLEPPSLAEICQIFSKTKVPGRE